MMITPPFLPKAKSVIPQLLYIAKSDFSSVRHAASAVLSQFGKCTCTQMYDSAAYIPPHM